MARTAGILVLAWSAGLGLVMALAGPPATSPAPASPAATGAPLYQDLQYRDDTWYGSTYWGGPNWTRVGSHWHHPGEQTPAVRTFVAPCDGRARVTGKVCKLDIKGGDGVRAEIRHNGRAVWKQALAAGDGKGVEHSLTLDLRKGDLLRFVVDKGGTIWNDTTGWDPLVAYEGGKQHQASADFAGLAQGAGGWRYEMQLPPGTKALPMPAPVRPVRPYPFVRGDLEAMVQAEWRWEDQVDGGPPAASAAAMGTAIKKHLAGAQALLSDLRRAHGEAFLRTQADRLAEVSRQAAALRADAESGGAMEKLYLDLRRLKRKIALANPLMDFGKLLVVKRVPTSYSHLVMQYFGWRARPGGGLFVVEQPGRSLACRDLLGGKLEGGNVLEPRLSCDGGRIVFSYVDCGKGGPVPGQPNEASRDERFYHLYEVNVDGTGLRQLTSGPYDDLMPEYLPDGGVVFCSTRRRGYARCFGGQFGQFWHVYTLHRMDPSAMDKDIRTLSFHDTNEWFPRVGPDGLVYYARWDYIDRDAVTHQNLWSTRPDGTNPQAVWGNALPKPHCTFQAQSVPGSSKFVFAASAHHSITGGCVTLLDPSLGPNAPEALLRLTPDIPFPEAEPRGGVGYYTSPWPLSENYFLVSYSPLPLVFEPAPNPRHALGIYLLDAWGNRELLYRDVEIGCENPCPLRARKSPPVIHSDLPPSAPPHGQVVISDIYQGLGDMPRGTIRQVRVVQIFPKTTHLANSPPVGLAGEENARAILGTAPVEADGSAHFTVPARTPVLFQALDASGNAYQTMRSLTYLQPGEKVSCVGCHERQPAGPPNRASLAAARTPSNLEPGPLGAQPFSYVRFVQPVLDRHCVRCHGGMENGQLRLDGKIDLRSEADPRMRAFTRSYVSLMGRPGLVQRHPARNQLQVTPPGGAQGAIGSRLIKLLRAGHEKISLSDQELRTLSAWIDCNAIFYGVNLPADQARQLKGEAVEMPAIQ